ncbi:MAG TPA: hypothetical protein VFJ04_08975 [Rhodanobacteraceae bacterium]|jgi:hypothetical protein|nr:hypothetical protein [Rhodanobacteraceae bacterium]
MKLTRAALAAVLVVSLAGCYRNNGEQPPPGELPPPARTVPAPVATTPAPAMTALPPPPMSSAAPTQ